MSIYQQQDAAQYSSSAEGESMGDDDEEDEYEYHYSDDEIEQKQQEEQVLTLDSISRARREKQQRNEDQLERSICPDCQQESHMPIHDCAVAAQWLDRIRNASSGIMTLDPDLVLRHGMRRHIDDFASFHNIPPKDAAQWLRQYHWNERNYVPEEDTTATATGGAAAVEDADDANAETRIELEHYQFLQSTIEESTAENIESASSNEVSLQQEKESESEEGSFSCGICFYDGLNQDEIMHMSCAHVFCRVCWLQYLMTRIQSHLNNPLATAACPEQGCRMVISDEEIRQVAPDLMPLYDQHQLNSFMIRHRATLCWCPGPDCRRVAVKPPASWGLPPNGTNNNDIVVCDSCQTRFSFDRGEEAAPVEQEALTSKMHKKEELIQSCPNCKVPIQKNGGCNHMICKCCGHHFCWICREDTSQGHYACSNRNNGAGWQEQQARLAMAFRENRARTLPPFDRDHILNAHQIHPLLLEQTATTLERAADLRRFCNLTRLFVAHEQSQRFAQNQCDCVKQHQQTFALTTELKSAADTDFLAKANERLVVSRCFLKYSYAYRYYYDKKEESPKKMALFLHHQELLEHFTERLSAASENACTRLDRSHVLNLLSSIERCLDVLAEG